MLLSSSKVLLCMQILALTIGPVQAQRVDYCFNDDYHPCDMQEEELNFEDDETHKSMVAFCNRMIRQYTTEGEDDIYDLDTWSIKFGEIPANSELCSDLQHWFPHCWWCFEQPCGFGKGKKRELTCNATYVELQRVENEDPVATFFEEPGLNDEISCLFWTDGFFRDGVLDNLTHHAIEAEGRVGSEEECQSFHQVYPKCYFCDPDANNITANAGTSTTSSESSTATTNQCTFDAICSRADQLRADADNINANMDSNATEEWEATCQQLEFLAYEWFPRQVFSTDLCNRATKAIATTCPHLCHSCFNETMPPTCNVPTPQETENYHQAFDEIMAVHEWVDPPVSICSHMASLFLALSPTDDIDPSSHMEILSNYRAHSPHCAIYRQSYHQCYWCGQDQEDNDAQRPFDCFHDEICVERDSSNLTFVGTEEEVEAFQSACRDLQSAVEHEWRATTRDLCQKAQKYSKFCHCWEAETDIEYVYLGANTSAKKKVLVWMPRVAAFLSFVGASYILYTVLSVKNNRDIVYYQLVGCMATFDLITAIAWAFSTAPIPVDVGYNIEGASGTDGTCTGQAFFIQLGFTSVFCNVALTVYYYLVIVKSYRELQLEAIRAYLFIPPIAFGLVLALVGLPFYQGFEYACHIQPVPHGEVWQVMLFAVAPIGASIIVITILMVLVYLGVRKLSRNSRRWRFSSGQSVNMEQQVFYQALFFTLSFYVTWPIVLCVYVTGWDHEKQNFGFAALVAFVAPLQGFNNALVFIRPKLKSPVTYGALRNSARNLSSRLFGARGSSNSEAQQPRRSLSFAEDDDGGDRQSRSKAKSSSGNMRSILRSMDPSVIIAFDEETIARFTESMGKDESVQGKDELVPGASEVRDPNSGDLLRNESTGGPQDEEGGDRSDKEAVGDPANESEGEQKEEKVEEDRRDKEATEDEAGAEG